MTADRKAAKDAIKVLSTVSVVEVVAAIQVGTQESVMQEQLKLLHTAFVKIINAEIAKDSEYELCGGITQSEGRYNIGVGYHAKEYLQITLIATLKLKK
jgi:hypothetical protein